MNQNESKTFLQFIFNQMVKLDKEEISTDQARTQALLCKQVNNALRYGLDRATVLMKIKEHNGINNDNVSLDDSISTKNKEIDNKK